MVACDLLIKNGLVVDGTGAPARHADIAIQDGKILKVFPNLVYSAKRTIDASGRLVTPGWVDVHTHFDGQILWDPYVTPASNNGVTSIVFGNCGIGFAPVAPNQREFLIKLMEGVEDIPGIALHEGLPWNWETFPEFLDVLERTPAAVDFGAMIGHAPVRTYVMGLRGAEHRAGADKVKEREASQEVADPIDSRDLELMQDVVAEAIEAGALGFSCSRSIIHRDVNGNVVPGSFAAEAEILAMGAAIQRGGGGVFETTSDFFEHLRADDNGAKEMEMLKSVSKKFGLPVTFSIAQNIQGLHTPGEYMRTQLQWLEDANSEGANVTAQCGMKGVAILQSLAARMHPLMFHPTFRSKVAHLPSLEEKVAAMRQPAIRAAIMAETEKVLSGGRASHPVLQFDMLFPWSPSYEPDPATDSFGALARAKGCHPLELVVDFLCDNNGRNVINYFATNYEFGNLDDNREMITHPHVRIGLADGGAHVGFLQDAANCTYALTHWVRDRSRGERLPLEFVVHKQTQETAQLFGLHDRGALLPGLVADVNVISMDELAIGCPEMVHDLPCGAKRWIQSVSGYDYTIKSGVVTYQGGEPSGEMPGKLIRNPRTSERRRAGGSVTVDAAAVAAQRRAASAELKGEVTNIYQKAERSRL